MRTITLGSMSVDRVADIDTLWVDASWLYPNMQPGMVERHKGLLGPLMVHPETEQLCLSFHSYVIRTGGKNVLVDSCVGEDKPRMPKMPWQHMLKTNTYMSNLARIGLAPEDIDIVLCTHLHADHVGWNTRLVDGRWVPTFPNARYVIAKKEFDHWAGLHATNPQTPVGHGSFADSVLPVVSAGLAEFVDLEHMVTGDLEDGIWMESATGHSPGHVTIHAKSRGKEAIMSGDMIHHPILFEEPSLVSLGDFDPEQADASRERLIHRCADTETLLLTAHFPSPTSGRVISRRGGFRFVFDK